MQFLGKSMIKSLFKSRSCKKTQRIASIDVYGKRLFSKTYPKVRKLKVTRKPKSCWQRLSASIATILLMNMLFTKSNVHIVRALAMSNLKI